MLGGARAARLSGYQEETYGAAATSPPANDGILFPIFWKSRRVLGFRLTAGPVDQRKTEPTRRVRVSCSGDRFTGLW